MSLDPTVRVVAAGHAHPAYEMGSDQLASSVPGLEIGWAQKRLGLNSRRVALPHEHMSQFGVAAVVAALDQAGWAPEELDGIVCGTSFVDDLLPATASLIGRDINPAALAFDVNAACASGPYGLAVARSMLATDPGISRVAVCVVERPTAWADYEDRESSVFWGDSAGCLLLERGGTSPGWQIEATALRNDSAYAEKVRVRRGGTFRHDGRYSRQQVLDMSEACALDVLAQVGIGPADIDHLVCHQSNIPLLRDLSERLGVDFERQWHNVEWAGNQGGAGVVTAFSGGWAGLDEPIADGRRVLLAAVGGGYTAGAVLLRWVTNGA
ncbi:MAG: 3-oxoacyl-ACP synthase III family protein [Acidimicrobiales bacterium]